MAAGFLATLAGILTNSVFQSNPYDEFKGSTFGDADKAVAGSDGLMPFGSGNTDNNYLNDRFETTIGRDNNAGFSVSSGMKVHERGGADIDPTSINLARGSAEYDVPTGPDDGNANRSEASFDWYINPNADGGKGHKLGDDAGEIGARMTISADANGNGTIEANEKAGLTWHDYDGANATVTSGPGDGYWMSDDGTVFLGDEQKDGFGADSVNLSFIDQLLGIDVIGGWTGEFNVAIDTYQIAAFPLVSDISLTHTDISLDLVADSPLA